MFVSIQHDKRDITVQLPREIASKRTSCHSSWRPTPMNGDSWPSWLVGYVSKAVHQAPVQRKKIQRQRYAPAKSIAASSEAASSEATCTSPFQEGATLTQQEQGKPQPITLIATGIAGRLRLAHWSAMVCPRCGRYTTCANMRTGGTTYKEGPRTKTDIVSSPYSRFRHGCRR